MAPIRAVGRRLFLGVERLFALAFGPRLNPLHRLGEITFLLFWIVVATGLYLYAFFKTGVHEAHGSLVMLQQTQPWVGGVLRSVHRYASDAMVVTMLLHLLRHFSFDRYRGYRWFSWLSGVAVLWLVYVSGIGGFMLPWDRLAQFVAVGTMEWLDRLPMFSGQLARNFIVDGAVSDRLFSLLTFMHIGVPLVLLMVLWIHVQRVPRARTTPPRAIALPLLFALVVLAVVRPVIGSDPAAFASLPASLSMDWFYLATFPLMYATSPDVAWIMLLTGTLVLAVLPWLPPQRGRTGWRVVFHPGARDILVRPGESLLDAGLREGLPMRYECRSGGCGLCRVHVIAGDVVDDSAQPGTVLACCATPRSDAEVEFEPALLGSGLPEIRRLRVTVAAMERAAPEVMILRLELPAGERLAFAAGQYFHVILEDGARRAFSFASAPGDSGRIEMHVRRIPGGRFTTRVFTTLRVGDSFDIEGPLGRFRLTDSARPIIFVAGATGFAPVKSMLEFAFESGMTRRMFLYWGVRHAADLYLPDLPAAWAREHPNFTFVPVLSEALPEDAWEGRRGLVHEAILQDFPDLAGFDLYTCGSARMVAEARPEFLRHGVSEDACFSDAFAPPAAPGDRH